MYNVSMFYIVGLGNPGEKYEDTRHNVGWVVVERVCRTFGLPEFREARAHSGNVSEGALENESVTLLQPTTFMNNSGSAVVKLVPKQESEHLIVVHDDIDLPFGEVKIGKGRGAGGNNGVQSIIDKLGTKDFVRIRVGIAPKSFWTGKVKRPQGGGPLERFVLKPFTGSEQKQLGEILDKTVAAIETIITKGVVEAMNIYN